MSYHYIALIDCHDHDHGSTNRGQTSSEPNPVFHAGHCIRHGAVKLYLSGNTPHMRLGSHGALIGHLFFRDGKAVSRPTQLAVHPNDASFQEYVLQECWGSYLLLQFSPKTPSVIKALRDPEGAVACIYSISNGRGFITSDIRTPVKLGVYQKRVNWDQITQRLLYPNMKGGHTGLSDIQELLPGASLTVNQRETRAHQRWSPWNFTGGSQRHRDPGQAAEELRGAIEVAVRSWARVDKHILLALSGGLDSSIIAASLRRADANFTSCTYVTPVPGGDERYYANAVTARLGLELDVLTLPLRNTKFHFPDGTHLPTMRVGMLQCAANAVMERAAIRHNASSYMSGAGGDTVFSYLPTAAPAADAVRELGPSGGMRAVSESPRLL